jgi:hypothetical protein
MVESVLGESILIVARILRNRAQGDRAIQISERLISRFALMLGTDAFRRLAFGCHATLLGLHSNLLYHTSQSDLKLRETVAVIMPESQARNVHKTETTPGNVAEEALISPDTLQIFRIAIVQLTPGLVGLNFFADPEGQCCATQH